MPAEEPHLRRVGRGDWAALRDLRLEALADTPVAYLETLDAARALGDDAWQARARRGAEGGDSVQVMAFDQQRAVSTSVGFVAGGTAWLAAVYVTPAWRGRGLLGPMVDRVGAWARERGEPRLTLEVHEDNGPARAAYARLGFAETGVRRPYPLDPTGDEVEMVLDLRRAVAGTIGYRRGLLRGAPP